MLHDGKVFWNGPCFFALRMTKRGLLIAINAYPNLEDSDLAGCRNDQQLFAQLLEDRFGFAPAALTLLCDAAATRDGILGALDALTAATQPGDQVFFYYSGHGSYRTRAAGGQQQTLVPHDSGRRGRPNRDISDDELGAWVHRLCEKTEDVVLVFDCCHSGTMTRAVPAEGPPTVPVTPGQPRCRWVEGGTEDAAATRLSPADDAPTAARVGPLPPSSRYLILAACQDGQLAWEYIERVGTEKIFHGMLSFFLLRELQQAGAQTTWRDLFERVRAPMKRERADQTPRCEGRLDRVVFSVDGAERPPGTFVPVLTIDDDRLTLGGGAIHGVDVDSQWALLVPGEADHPGAPLAQVSAVSDLSATAQLVQRGPLALPLRAVQRYRPALSRLRLRIDTAADCPTELPVALAARLSESPWLRIADDGAPSALRLSLRAAGGAVYEGEGELLGTAPGPLDAAALGDLLEALGRLLHVRRIDNRHSGVAGDVTWQLLRQGPQGFAPVADEVGGVLRCRSGDRLRLGVRNRAKGRRYVSVLSLGSSLAIEPLWPPRGVPGEALAPDEERSSEDFELYTPPRPVLAPAADGCQRQYLKLFVSDDELDLEPLFYRGLSKATGAGDDELSRRLRAALCGEVPRELRPTVRRDWATDLRELRWR